MLVTPISTLVQYSCYPTPCLVSAEIARPDTLDVEKAVSNVQYQPDILLRESDLIDAGFHAFGCV